MEIMINKQILNVDYADTFYKRFKGLMGKKEFSPLFFPNTGSIHTFFMKTNIDVIMLDKEMRVIFIKRNISKNRIIIQKKAKYTIEFSPNTTDFIKINDLVTIKK